MITRPGGGAGAGQGQGSARFLMDPFLLLCPPVQCPEKGDSMLTVKEGG